MPGSAAAVDATNVTTTLGDGGATLEAPLVVASDVHLRTLEDRRGELLVDALGRLGRGVEWLVLNGDVFDFCFGGSRYFRRKFAGLGAILEAIATRGTRVVFVEGNHEFHLDEIGWRGVEVVDRPIVATLRDGTRVKIAHGDLVLDDPWYRAFRGLIKSRFIRTGASLLPGSWLDGYSLRHAAVSRSRDKYRTLDHARILGAFNRWLRDEEAQHGVIGHFHVPYAERRELGDGLLLSVESWDNPNLLVYGDGRFQRIHLAAPGVPFRAEPAESIFNG
jgi:UDP-2,3-diacylglucosamine hydrolase